MSGAFGDHVVIQKKRQSSLADIVNHDRRILMGPKHTCPQSLMCMLTGVLHGDVEHVFT